MAYGEMIFRIGVGLLIAAAIGAVVSLVLFSHEKKKLGEQLETEYGKPRDKKGA